ncbi:T9SS type B sorting domain-containing protein, partial [Flavobacterium sp.]
TTQIAPPVCGGQFTDAGGVSGPYPNSANITTTICPANASEVVTVTFSSFNTEANWDGLYVYDGNSAAAPQIASTNGAGFGALTQPGAFWGNLTGAAIPGPFTSTSNDGCLTFVFRSDGSFNNPGWVSSVTCSPAPNCAKPITLTSTEITSNSALLGWTETNPAVTQWEIIIVPFGSPVPLPTATGTLVSINPALFSGLDPGTRYTFYVRALCPTSGTSAWSNASSFSTLVINDNCSGAIFVPVNSSAVCQQVAAGTVAGATASTPALQAPCVGSADDDVWFQFIASNTYLNVALQNVAGSNTNLNFAAYSGSCGALTQIFCSAANSLSGVLNNLVIGQTYFIRVYSNANSPQTTTFELCISTPSTCLTGSTVCSLTDYGNTTGVTSLGTIGCLFTSPNPAFFAVEVATTGPINFTLTQSTFPSVNGVPGTPNLDVDYAAWGPFANQAAACAFIGNVQPFAAPGIGVPVTQQTGCSYSAAPTETLNLTNAQAGQVYIILITNYSNQAGYINLTQTNSSSTNSGTTNCCPDAYFSYNPSSFCIEAGALNPLPIIAVGSISGTFSSTIVPGLVFVDSGTSTGSLTGQIDLANSLPGNYIITNTTLVTATCTTSKVKYFTVNLSLPTAATIAYSDTSYCKNVTTPQVVTQTGTTGGNYSVLPNGGLYINTATGSFNPSLSAPGNYTITYNIPGNGVCANANPSAQVEIKAVPNVVSPGNQTVCGSYELLPITVGNYFTATNGGGVMLNAGDLISSTQDIYIYANNNGCTDEKMFTVTVNPAIVVDVIDDFGTCAGYNLLPLTVGSYYTGPNGTGTMLNAGDPILVTTTLYIYATNGTCSDESMFTITIGGLTVTAPESASFCNSYELQTPTLGNYYTEAGGLGTLITTPATITATQTFFLYANVDGCEGEDSFTVTINTVATPTVDITQPTCAMPSGTIVITSPTGSTSGTLPSDLFISEVTDAQAGSLTYIEIYNGTGSPKNLADYKIAVYNNGNNYISPNCDITLTGTLNNDSVFVLSMGENFNLGGVTPNMVVANCGAINENDNIRLVSSSNVLIDTWGRNDGVDFTPNNQPGYTYRRIATSVVPSTTWNPSDWTALDTEDYSNVGSYTFTTSTTSSYEYNLDGGTYQANTTFTPVAPGSHLVTVRDVVTGCISEPFEVIINDIPLTSSVTEFGYTTPVCQISTSNPTPTTATGFTAGGTYSYVGTGLDLNAITGEINLATTTAGTYTVTYTVLEDLPNCIAAGAYPFDITINQAVTPEVSFSYATPVCKNEVNPTPIRVVGFTDGGTYSYVGAGLDLNTATGEINLVNSTAGTYDIIYTVLENTTLCQLGLVSSPVSITITDVVTPLVAFSYTSPVCPDGSNELPNLGAGFTTGGTFSATAGLVINGSTGEIDVQASSAGMYTVSYIVAADTANCQAQTTGTAQFIINDPFMVEAYGDCQGAFFVLSANPVGSSFDPLTVTYNWENGVGISVGTTRTVVASATGIYTVTVTSNGCTSTGLFTVDSISCVIQKGISADGDGLNDNFELTGLGVKKLVIFNRYGMKVYTKDNYTNEWFGQSDKGDELPDATYYYVIERNNGESITGWIYVNRAQ